MNPLNHPGVHQIPENDVEKRGEVKATEVNVTTNDGSDTSCSDQHDIAPTPVLLKGNLAKWNAKVERLAGLEARGITRVLPEEQHGGGLRGYLQMALLWFSLNMAATNVITGLLGPLVFQLGWVDSVCIVIFATGLSACGPSYTATFGPQSGNRTMVRSQAEHVFQSLESFRAALASFDVSVWLERLIGEHSLICTDCSSDHWSIFHGLLAFKDCLYSQLDHANWLGNHWMYYRRPDVFGRKRRRLEYRRWLCYKRTSHWPHRHFWYRYCPHS